MDGRKTALDVLISCRKQGAWANGALKEYILRDRLDRRDAALAARLCYGVLQNRYWLDFTLQQLLTGKVKDLHPVVRDILHLGLYQICFLDKIPASAAVNEAVAQAKKYCPGQRWASGLVNAVLRKASQNKGSLRPPRTLQERYSHPQVLIDLLGSYVGSHRLEAMLAANNMAPQTVVQVNTLRTNTDALLQMLSAEGIEAEKHSWMPDCLILGSTGNLEKLQSFQDGLFYVQDPAAKLSVFCARLPEEENVQILDCCAAPGGKSFAAAIALKGQGVINSCDIHAHKTVLIRNGADRLGIGNIKVYQQDASQENPAWLEKMDAVIADVPCSGYGIIRKKPDIRYKDPKEMQQLPGLQLQILTQQARYVKPGGTLLYSTCTLVRAENEGVVEKFLEHHPEFHTEALQLPHPFPENKTGMLTLVPGEYDTDGFFICRLRRKA